MYISTLLTLTHLLNFLQTLHTPLGCVYTVKSVPEVFRKTAHFWAYFNWRHFCVYTAYKKGILYLDTISTHMFSITIIMMIT